MYINNVVRLVLLIAATICSFNVSAVTKPKLILQITVDQLRGDIPMKYFDSLGEGGLRYLLENGIYFNNAHHAHANTETIVGHATLATGAHPAAHGMIGNIWFDRKSGQTIYNIEDPDHSLLTSGGGVNNETEIDPTQRAANTDGRSPRAILTTTFSDELAVLSAGKSKIFSISIKDRAAVAMAGHAGKAFWFSKSSSQFVTSDYYYDAYPDWVDDWNAEQIPASYSGKSWELLNPQDSYLFGDSDNQAWEVELGDYGRIFPHEFSTSDNPYFTTFLTVSPVGDEITSNFAKTLIDAEQLGADEITDYLSVSYSATDYIGHFFGPSSLEAEDNILRLDRTLADLFSFVDERIGLENTLIVLSADHGGPEAPGFLNSLNIPADYVSPDEWDTAPAIQRIRDEFNIQGKLIEGYDHPYVYLSNEVINNPQLNLANLEKAIAEELITFDGVAYAIPSTALEQGAFAENALTRVVLNNYNAARSGNIYLVFNPSSFINDMDGLSAAIVHGSPWRYDTYVPIIFAGYDIAPKKIFRRVHTVDIALTLSTLVGARPPSGASGEILHEVLGQAFHLSE